MRASLPLLLLSLAPGAGCVTYELGDGKDLPAFDSGDDSPPDEDSDAGETGDTSEPPDCALEAPAGGSVAIDESCADRYGALVPDPWNVTVEWSYYAGDRGVSAMPAVGSLDDDDGDGDVDGEDVPEIAVVEWFGYLSLLDGPTGNRRWRLTGFDGTSAPVIADVTGDGTPEILAFTSDKQLVALNAGGTPVWTSPRLEYTYSMGQLSVADLDNDGVAEVLFDDLVLDGATGALLARVDTTKLYFTNRAPIAADLDLDGTREIVIGNVVARPDGSIRASVTPEGPSFAAVGNLDDDPEGEIVMVTVEKLRVYEGDLTLVVEVDLDSVLVGPPAIADFDGDGAAEIAVPDGKTLRLFEADGTQVWEAPADDDSGAAGVSGFDVDGDGAIDALFAGEDTFRIYDGRTGEVRYEDTQHDSQTLFEYPVVGDIDGDGSAEILVASALYHGGRLGITAYGHTGGAWGPAGPAWGAHDFALTNLGSDGSVPTGETAPWLLHNCYRARPASDVPGLANLAVELGEPCITGCGSDGWIELAWQVGNRGTLPSEPATLTLYAWFGEREEALASVAVPGMASGERAPGGVFRVEAPRMAGASAYEARLDAPADCSAADDTTRVDVVLCP